MFKDNDLMIVTALNWWKSGNGDDSSSHTPRAAFVLDDRYVVIVVIIVRFTVLLLLLNGRIWKSIPRLSSAINYVGASFKLRCCSWCVKTWVEKISFYCHLFQEIRIWLWHLWRCLFVLSCISRKYWWEIFWPCITSDIVTLCALTKLITKKHTCI